MKKRTKLIVAITSIKRVIKVFTGPFLIAFILNISEGSIVELSIFNIIFYLIIGVTSFCLGFSLKKTSKLMYYKLGIAINIIVIGMLALGVNHLALIAFLLGVATAFYYMPFNIMISKLIANNERPKFEAAVGMISTIIAVIIPVILGILITITSFQTTALLIAFLCLVQIVLALKLTDEEAVTRRSFNIKSFFNYIKNKKQVITILKMDMISGLAWSGGLLELLATVLIIYQFKTDFNLGLFTSLFALLSFLTYYIIGKLQSKYYKIVLICTIIGCIINLIAIMSGLNLVTIIIYNIFVATLLKAVSRIHVIRLFNITNKYHELDYYRTEYFVSREMILNTGRVLGFILLLVIGLLGDFYLIKSAIALISIFIVIVCIMGMSIRD